MAGSDNIEKGLQIPGYDNEHLNVLGVKVSPEISIMMIYPTTDYTIPNKDPSPYRIPGYPQADQLGLN